MQERTSAVMIAGHQDTTHHIVTRKRNDSIVLASKYWANRPDRVPYRNEQNEPICQSGCRVAWPRASVSTKRTRFRHNGRQATCSSAVRRGERTHEPWLRDKRSHFDRANAPNEPTAPHTTGTIHTIDKTRTCWISPVGSALSFIMICVLAHLESLHLDLTSCMSSSKKIYGPVA